MLSLVSVELRWEPRRWRHIEFGVQIIGIGFWVEFESKAHRAEHIERMHKRVMELLREHGGGA